MKKPSVLIELLKLLATVIIGWFIWLCIFAAMSPVESDDFAEPFFDGSSVVFGILTGLILLLGIKYNSVHREGQKILAAKSNIGIVEEKNRKLLDKANRVADKYMTHETAVQVGVAAARSSNGSVNKGKIKTANQFQQILENYPDLKANESIVMLLNQIRDCENAEAKYKMSYNDNVMNYNAMINSFPAVFFRKIGRFKEMEFYQTAVNDDIISDEELGI